MMADSWYDCREREVSRGVSEPIGEKRKWVGEGGLNTGGTLALERAIILAK
jgi:hypothetical protein